MKEMILPSSPFKVEFEITNRCNLNCFYCFAKPPCKSEIPFNHLIDFFHKTKSEVNPFEVLILGGEPFIRKDIVEILTEAAQIFKTIQITTNGTLINRLSPSEITQLGLLTKNLSIQISLDCINPTINDSIRGGTDLTINGLNLLEINEIPFSIGIVLTKLNITEIRKTINSLLKNFQLLQSINLMSIMPSILLGKKYFNYRVTLEEFFNTRELIKKLLKDSNREILLYRSENIECDSIFDSLNFKTCVAGVTKVTVLPNGDVIPCSILRKNVAGNLYDDSWEEINSKLRKQCFEYQNRGITDSLCAYYNLK